MHLAICWGLEFIPFLLQARPLDFAEMSLASVTKSCSWEMSVSYGSLWGKEAKLIAYQDDARLKECRRKYLFIFKCDPLFGWPAFHVDDVV